MIDNKIECYISKKNKESIKYIPIKSEYGVVRFEVGNTALIFKEEDIRKILGGK